MRITVGVSAKLFLATLAVVVAQSVSAVSYDIAGPGTSGGTRSVARNVNGDGQVVGFYDTAGDYCAHAFLWSNGTLRDLNDLLPVGSGWILESALDINDAGQIVGTGFFNGQSQAFLMMPVPVPASLWLLGSGLLGFIGAAKKRKIT